MRCECTGEDVDFAVFIGDVLCGERASNFLTLEDMLKEKIAIMNEEVWLQGRKS